MPKVGKYLKMPRYKYNLLLIVGPKHANFQATFTLNRQTLDTTLLNAVCGHLGFKEGASDTKTETHTQLSTLEHPRWHFLYGRAKQL